MTHEEVAALTPGTPVWVAEYSVFRGNPVWNVESPIFVRVDPADLGWVRLRNPNWDDDSTYAVAADVVHPSRYAALQWVAGRLSEYMRAGQDAVRRLGGEMVKEACGSD